MLFLTALRLHWPQPCNPSEPSEISTEVAWAKPGSISYRSMPAMLPNIKPKQALGSPQGCLNVPNDSDWKHKLALGTRFAFGLFQSLNALSKFKFVSLAAYAAWMLTVIGEFMSLKKTCQTGTKGVISLPDRRNRRGECRSFN